MSRFSTLGIALALILTTACGESADGGADKTGGAPSEGQAASGSGAGEKAASEASPGPKTIPSGMAGVPDIEILKVHKSGSGNPCGTGKTATLKYTAMLANGTVVDPGARPFTFPVGAGRAIRGWDIIVARMKVGDSWTVKIPSQLAYGARGAGGRIPPNTDMKFDMELLSVQ